MLLWAAHQPCTLHCDLFPALVGGRIEALGLSLVLMSSRHWRCVLVMVLSPVPAFTHTLPQVALEELESDIVARKKNALA